MDMREKIVAGVLAGAMTMTAGGVAGAAIESRDERRVLEISADDFNSAEQALAASQETGGYVSQEQWDAVERVVEQMDIRVPDASGESSPDEVNIHIGNEGVFMHWGRMPAPRAILNFANVRVEEARAAVSEAQGSGMPKGALGGLAIFAAALWGSSRLFKEREVPMEEGKQQTSDQGGDGSSSDPSGNGLSPSRDERMPSERAADDLARRRSWFRR